MMGPDNNDHTGLADLQPAHAMGYRDMFDAPALPSLGDNLADFGERHLWIHVVLQIAHLFAPCVVAHHTLKDHNPAYARMRYCRNQSCAVQWLMRNRNHV